MKAKVICIEAYWNDKRTYPHTKFERRCAVVPHNATDEQREDLLERIDEQLFYVFNDDELIIGEHLDFTVFFYNPLYEVSI